MASLGRRLRRDPESGRKYREGMEDLFSKGYVVEVP